MQRAAMRAERSAVYPNGNRNSYCVRRAASHRLRFALLRATHRNQSRIFHPSRRRAEESFMSKLDFFRPRTQKSKPRVARKSVGTRRLGRFGRNPHLEALEERALLAITVTPSTPNGWVVANFDNAGVGGTVTDFVLGPATPPSGVGSLHLHVGADGNDAARLRTSQ